MTRENLVQVMFRADPAAVATAREKAARSGITLSQYLRDLLDRDVKRTQRWFGNSSRR